MNKCEKEAVKQFKKHYKKMKRLKEGGSAWEREISECEKYIAIIIEEQKLERERK